MDDLRERYSLRIQEFELQFLTTSRNLEWLCVMAAKQINLLKFRELCLERHPLPDALFLFTKDQFALSEQIIPFFANYPSGEVTFDFVTELITLYPETPWIVQYFVHSTFPAMFCNFVSAEYLSVGCRFLESHISDRLIAQLVGVYLLHCFTFRARLQECFCRRALTLPAAPSDAQLLDAFVECVEQCAQYLSEHHVRILQLLAGRSRASALAAVCCFLTEIVRQWKHCPLLRELSILARRRVPATPVVQSGDLRYDFLLLPRLRRVADDAPLGERLLLLLTGGSAVTSFARIQQVVYFEGIEFSLSVLDLDVMIHLFRLLGSGDASRRQPAPAPADAVAMRTNAFTIRTRSRHYPKAPRGMPVPTERSEDVTPLKLRENKAMHDYLLSIAGNLHGLARALDAANGVLALANRALAAKLVKVRESREATTDFAVRQRTAYFMQIFAAFVRTPLLEYVTGFTQGSVETVHGKRIDREVEALHAQGRPLAQCIVDAAIAYVNRLKDDFTGDFPDDPQLHCNVQGDVEYPLAEMFVNAAGALGFALAMEKTSRTRIRLCGEIEKRLVATTQPLLKVQALSSLVQLNSREDALFRGRCLSDVEPEVVAAAEAAAELRSMLQRLDQVFMGVLQEGEEQFGSGNRVFVFLEIERLLRAVVEENALWAEAQCHVFVVMLFDGRDPVYLRGFLLRLVVLIRDLANKIRDLGEVVGGSVVKAFDNLRSWFGFVDARLLRGEL